MKPRDYIFYTIAIFVILGCTKTTFIDDPTEKDEIIVRHHYTTTSSTTHQTPTNNYTTNNYSGTNSYTTSGDLVQVKFGIQCDYPSGPTREVTVWKNDQILTENTLLTPGTYNFRIEKLGYETMYNNVQVNRNYEDHFLLTGVLKAKERLMVFNFIDARTNKPLVADKISIAEIGGGSETQIISNQSYIKPGRKIVVIEKSGYNTLSQEFDMLPGETSYILNANLTPK